MVVVQQIKPFKVVDEENIQYLYGEKFQNPYWQTCVFIPPPNGLSDDEKEYFIVVPNILIESRYKKLIIARAISEKEIINDFDILEKNFLHFFQTSSIHKTKLTTEMINCILGSLYETQRKEKETFIIDRYDEDDNGKEEEKEEVKGSSFLKKYEKEKKGKKKLWEIEEKFEENFLKEYLDDTKEDFWGVRKEKILEESKTSLQKFFENYILLNIQQIIGLFIVTLNFLKRRWIINILQLFIPLLCLLFLRIVSNINDTYLKDSLDILLDNTPNKLGIERDINTVPLNLYQLQCFIAQNFDGDFPNQILFVENGNLDMGYHYLNNTKDGFLASSVLNDYYCNISSSSTGEIHKKGLYFQKVSSERDMDDMIYSSLNKEELENKYNDILAAFSIFKFDANALEYTIQTEKKMKRRGGMNSGQTIAQFIKNNYSDSSSFCQSMGIVTQTYECENIIVSLLMNLINKLYIFEMGGENRIVATNVQQMPHRSRGFEIALERGESDSALFYPLIVILLLPVFLQYIVSDKESQTRELMQINGLRLYNYLLVNYFSFFIYYIVYCFMFVLYAWLIFDLRYFSQTNFFLIFIILVGNGLSLISFAFFVSAFLNDSFLSILVGYFLAVVSPAFLGVQDEKVIEKGNYLFKPLLLIFPFPTVDAFFQSSRPILQKVSVGLDFLYKDTDFLLAILFLYINAVLYFLAYLYLERVLPQNFGVRKHPLFCILCCLKKKNVEQYTLEKKGFIYDQMMINEKNQKFLDEDVKTEKEYAAGIENEELKDYGIVIKELFKRYSKGDKFAVNGITFRINKNEVFALLGQNGAGKTTTIKMLCGLLKPSYGTAYINGNDISEKMGTIRSNLGYTPQFNVLWSELTVKEHLYFYARLKNINPLKHKEHVEEIMKATDLLEVEKDKKADEKLSCWKRTFRWLFYGDKKVKDLTEGTKRRLAIAIALIGDPKIIFLDEPSTSLDFKCRHQIWNIILEQKKNKCIVLTTHDMREANTLSDTISVMANGNVVAFGSSIDLKSKFGSGYILKVNYEDENKRTEIIEFINNLIPATYRKISKDYAKMICYEVSRNFSKVATIFNEMEKYRGKLGINDWSMNQSSLEDVFLNLVSDDQKSKEDLVVENKQLKIEIKRLEKKIVDGKDHVVDDEDSEMEEIVERHEAQISSEKPKFYSNSIFGYLTLSCCQFFVLLKKEIKLSYRNPFLSLFVLLVPMLLCLMIYAISIPFKDPITLYPEKNRVEDISECQIYGDNKNCYNFVFTTNGNSFAETVMDDLITENLFASTDFQNFTSEFEMIDWIKNHTNQTDMAISFSSIESMGFPYTEYTLFLNTTSPNSPSNDLSIKINKFQTLIDNAILYQTLSKPEMIKVNLKAFPTYSRKNNPSSFDLYYILGPNFYSLSGLFVLILALNNLVREKEKNQKKYLFVMGVRKVPYYCSHIVLFIIFSFLTCCIVYFTSAVILRIPMFIESNFFVNFTYLFAYTVSIVLLSLVFSIILQTGRQAFIFDFFFIISIYFLSILFDGSIVYSLYQKSSNVFEYFLVYFVLPIFLPMWNFSKIYVDICFKTLPFYNFETKDFDTNVGYSFKDLFFLNSFEPLNLQTHPTYVWFIYLFADILLYVLVFLLLSHFTSRFDDYKNLLGKCCKCCGGKGGKRKSKVKKDDLDGASILEEIELKEKEENEEVEEEELGEEDIEEKLSRDLIQNVYFCEFENVVKEFKPLLQKKITAINDISFGISDPHFCCGIIGDSASGKSTILKILANWHKKSSGNIHFKNEDCLKRRNIGFTPQNDIFFEKLTAYEMLQLCGVAKGIKNLREEIAKVLNNVGLSNNSSQMINSLSGGMKRKLSLAISLLGCPDLLLLDEFLNGIDPFSRRELLNTIYEQKHDKLVFVTSKEIEEISNLCDHIIVLKQGKIALKGNPSFIKAQHDHGFNITLVAKESKSIDLLKWVDNNLPQREVISSHDNFFIFNIKKMYLRYLINAIAEIEKEMQNPNGFLENWGIQETTLHDVYLDSTLDFDDEKLKKLEKRMKVRNSFIVHRDTINSYRKRSSIARERSQRVSQIVGEDD